MKNYSTKILTFMVPVLFFCAFAQSLKAQEANTEPAKKQIANAEADFAKMVAEQGIAKAFYYFADDNATIKRQNDTLITGKENIRKFYATPFYEAANVTWSPDFIEVSAAGDLGYTYGKYVWKGNDGSGKPVEYHGVFHTVWKKNKNGEWKYVWD